MSGTYLSNPYQRPADPRTFRGGCRRQSGVGWRGGAFSGRALDPCQLRLQERCVSQSMYRRRRRWRTVASTLALTLGSLAIPATALADGLIDPNFNGTGYAVGPVFSGQDNRVPMVIEPDGKIVVGGSAGGAMTLIRYNLDGSVDSTFGNGGVAQRQFAGTPNERRRQQRRDGDDARRAPATSSSPASAARSRGRRSLRAARHLSQQHRLLRSAPDRLPGPRPRRQAERLDRRRGLRPRSPCERCRSAAGADTSSTASAPS